MKFSQLNDFIVQIAKKKRNKNKLATRFEPVSMT